jgi:hypothetical protein
MDKAEINSSAWVEVSLYVKNPDASPAGSPLRVKPPAATALAFTVIRKGEENGSAPESSPVVLYILFLICFSLFLIYGRL